MQIDKKTVCIVIGILLIIGFGSWYLFGRSDVSDNGNGADKARTELSNAQNESAKIGEGLDNLSAGLDDDARTAGNISTGLGEVSKGVGQSEDSITTTKERLGRDQEELSSIESILDENDRIYKSVRARKQSGNSQINR